MTDISPVTAAITGMSNYLGGKLDQANQYLHDLLDKDPCTDHPERVGCQELGVTPPAGDPPSRSTVNLTVLTLGHLPESGTCPAPRSFSAMGHTYVMSYTGICDAASTYFKPFALVLASMAAYLIFVEGLKT